MNPPLPDSSVESSAQLLALVRDLVTQLHPGAGLAGRVCLASSLDRDLGFDSLARVELVLRIERAFGLRLPDGLLAEAQTVQDLLTAIGGGEAAAPATPITREWSASEEVATPPDATRTLVEALQWHAVANPTRIHIHLLIEQDQTISITYRELYDDASKVADALASHGVRPSDTVSLMLPTGRDFFVAFMGILLSGAVPVPIYPPARLNQIEDHLLRQKGILSNARAVAMITVDQAKPVARILQGQVASLRFVATVADLSSRAAAHRERVSIQSEDLAFIQYTSGSTGNPKGVMLTHANLLASIRAMRKGLDVTSRDVFVSWLPLYHDMGLIGAWLGSLYCAYTLVIMSPLAFLARPVRWLQAIHRFGGTLSAAPNFAYELCASRIDDRDLAGLDLSTWRLALNGAEPVSHATIERFIARYAPFGFPRSAMLPVYGLAESTLGVTFPELGRGPVVDTIQREPFVTGGRAVPAGKDAQDVLHFVACGDALPGHAVRIVDDHDQEVGERIQGHLQFKGPSATKGYFLNPEDTARMRHGEWLDSFDFAYRVAGDIYITGRAKDIIIRAGRNLYPYELETAVGDLAGVRRGCVAVFGSRDPRSGTERLVVVAESREPDRQAREQLIAKINALALELTGSAADQVVLAAPHSVLKTSSGKIRRASTRERYEQGLLDSKQSAVWRQFLRLGLSGAGGAVAGILRKAMRSLYSLYAVAAFTLCGLIAYLLAMVMPVSVARRLTQTMARTALRLIGLNPVVSGQNNLPKGRAFVAVANHSSYLDGPILFATLAGTPSFVIKGELAVAPLVGSMLRKIGMQFVERFDVERSLRDAENLGAILRGRGSLVFFPEGTLRRTPGLLPFRTGAFTLAARAGVPIVPVVLRGTRYALPDGEWLPRHGAIEVRILPPVEPASSDFAGVLALRDQSRQAILQQIDEPEIVELVETVLTKQP